MQIYNLSNFSVVQRLCGIIPKLKCLSLHVTPISNKCLVLLSFQMRSACVHSIELIICGFSSRHVNHQSRSSMVIPITLAAADLSPVFVSPVAQVAATTVTTGSVTTKVTYHVPPVLQWCDEKQLLAPHLFLKLNYFVGQLNNGCCCCCIIIIALPVNSSFEARFTISNLKLNLAHNSDGKVLHV